MKALRRALALFLLASACALAQFGPIPLARPQFFDSNGYPLAGGFVWTYAAGTSTPLATYTDFSGTVANQNPVQLDGGGFASIYLSAGSKYRLVVQNAASVTIWTADNVAATVTGAVNQGAAGGDMAVQYAFGGMFAGDPTFTFNPTTKRVTATSFAGDGSCITNTGFILAACYGVSASNSDNLAALNTVSRLAFDPANDGQAHQTKIQLPCGTLKVSGPFQPTPLTEWYACGRGDSAQLVPPAGRGTVIQATSAFAGQTGIDHAVIVLGGTGPASSEYFGVKLFGLTVDANNVAETGIFIGNCQEMCGWDSVQVTNITGYGIIDWGADNNGNSGTVNAPWGLAANYHGSANDGTYLNTEIFGYSGASAATVPLLIANVAGLRGFKGISVVMHGVNGDPVNDATVPNVCAAIWGTSADLQDLHCEGPRDGFVFGPAGGAPSQYGDGAGHMSVSNIQYSSPSNGCAVHIENAKGLEASGIRGPSGSAVCDDPHSYRGNDSWYVTDYDPVNNVMVATGSLAGINSNAPITTTNTVNAGFVQAGSLKIEGNSSPCFTYQFVESTPYLFPFLQTCVTPNGDLNHTIVGEAVGQPQPKGDEYYQGAMAIAMGVCLNKCGLNLSSPLNTANDVMAVVGNNLSWDPTTNDFYVGYNGQSDVSGVVFDYNGAHFVGNATVGTTAHYSAVTKLNSEVVRNAQLLAPTLSGFGIVGNGRYALSGEMERFRYFGGSEHVRDAL